MVRRLSSLQTFFCKFILPPLWIGAFGLMAARQINAANLKVWPLVLLAWIVGTGWVYWSCVRLKKVTIDERYLYVSNYLQEIAIPFSLVGDVTENKWLNQHPVTIHFKLRTEFGEQIVFMPPVRFVPYVSSHPVVAELKQLANIL